MKKLLLIAMAGAFALGQAYAQTDVKATLFEPEVDFCDEDGQLLTGGVYNVSNNGKWAVSNDEFYTMGSYWNADDPDTFVILPNRGMGMDVSDDGLIVGCFRLDNEVIGSRRPGIFRDGAWEQLPLSDKCLNDGMTALAVCISKDGKYIAGYQTVEKEFAEQTGGAKLPCLWQYNAAMDEYDLVGVYDDPEIANQGFYTTCMSDDGRYIGGMLTCGSGSSTIPALFVDGKLKIWNELSAKSLPFYYKGEILGYDDFFFIDGHHDDTGSDFFGAFRWLAADGKFYGYRTKVTNIVPDAHGEGLDAGDLHVYGCVYDPATDEFTDGMENELYVAAIIDENNNPMIFSSAGVHEYDKNAKSITAYFDVDSFHPLGMAIYCADDAGRVFGGAAGELNAVTGDVDEYPLVIMLEKGISSVESLTEEDVEGIEEVYSLDGMKIGESARSAMKPGIYLLKSGKATKKVLVK